jgi:small-conductance mechanosensitive channel
MNEIYLRIIETIVVVICLMIFRQIVVKLVSRRLNKVGFDLARRKLTIKVINFISGLILLLALAGIWGVKRTQVFAYLTSVLTILGIGFFAQWSLLSNITSGLILFFNHPMKIGDYVTIIDKDLPLDGQIEDITFFFLHIRDRSGRVFTISNTEMIQKKIIIMNEDEFKKSAPEKMP